MNQALINEHKGYVFEYLVSQYFARNSNKGELPFIQSINKEDFLRLENYQQLLYTNDALLYKELPHLAKSLVDYYIEKNKIKKNYTVHLASRSSEHNSNADIVLDYGDRKLFLSLKLSKDQVYVNTKSAGIKSFLLKYFPNAKQQQIDLNQKVLQSFEKMRFHLLDHFGHELSGKLFEQWQSEGKAIVPGALPVELRPHLLEYYHDCILAIYTHVSEILTSDPTTCYKTFAELCGLSTQTQHLFCFHHGTDNYQLSRLVDINRSIIDNEVPKIVPPARGSSYFLINYSQLTLQIRVKPMRDFTAPAMKINCAIKLKNRKVL